MAPLSKAAGIILSCNACLGIVVLTKVDGLSLQVHCPT